MAGLLVAHMSKNIRSNMAGEKSIDGIVFLSMKVLRCGCIVLRHGRGCKSSSGSGPKVSSRLTLWLKMMI